MSCDCGCCAGVVATTPVPEENRPGLRAISHRPGDYARFFSTMRARMSSSDYPELSALKTRAPDDASIAFCDVWAIAAEVLSFYQDRIANEGYLRTATERQSVVQLGRLIGYEPRPGVSATGYVAYTVDPNAVRAEIPAGTRVQSVPGPGETMQTFETAEALSARSEWNRLDARVTQPQWRAQQGIDNVKTFPAYSDAKYNVLAKDSKLYIDGTSTQLKPNDVLIIDYDAALTNFGNVKKGTELLTPYRVEAVAVDATNKCTELTLRAWSHARIDRSREAAGGARTSDDVTPPDRMAAFIKQLENGGNPLPTQPRSSAALTRDVSSIFGRGGDVYPNLLLRQVPALNDMLVPALKSADTTVHTPKKIRVYALRAKASLFGSTAPNPFVTIGPEEGKLSYTPLSISAWGKLGPTTIPLDAVYDQVKPSGDRKSWVIAELPNTPLQILEIESVRTTTMAIGSAVAAQVTQLTVDQEWLPQSDAIRANILQGTRLFLQTEELTLAGDPLPEMIAGGGSTPAEIELDQYYQDLSPGLWLIAEGERADVDEQVKVAVAERVMIASVRHGLTLLKGNAPKDNGNLPGDTLHTFITLATPLAYSYRRATFTLYGNVVRVSHGETKKETLGSGDATQIYQTFKLKSPPLTYVPAATPDGAASTLAVRVNKLLWHETDDIASETPSDRKYTTRRDDADATSVRFGDGKHGARLPTGQENVTAVYRAGLGTAGNVRAGQLTIAADRPLGVTGVDNPMRASGGADRDTCAQARVNAPISVTALDRLVSVQDHADFACMFAGIGKAAATRLSGPSGEFVHVTIAGIDDGPIDTTSDLYRDLVEALHDFGDPKLPLRVGLRIALSLVVQASVRINPDYAWEDVQPKIRARLLARLGFAARAFGQPVIASEIIGAIQSVEGVAHVVAGEVRLFSYDDLVAGLVPLSPDGDDTNKAPNSNQWFSLNPVPNATDEGSGRRGWLSIPLASDDAPNHITAASIAYVPAGIPDCIILELAP